MFCMAHPVFWLSLCDHSLVELCTSNNVALSNMKPYFVGSAGIYSEFEPSCNPFRALPIP